MKLKYADRKDWKRIVEKSWKAFERRGYYFNGWVSILEIHKVREPLFVNYEERQFCLVNNGYTWVQYFPKGESFVITVMLNEQKEVVQRYIDICYSHGLTENGVPWYKDLYLDIIIFPDGQWKVVDEDELQDALVKGKISRQEFDYAWYITRKLTKKLENNSLYLMEKEPEFKEKR